MEKIQLKPITEQRIGKIEPVEQQTGKGAPVTYMQDQMSLHETLASGNMDDGTRFTVCHNYGRLYVKFQGLKGSIPNLGVNIKELIQVAYEVAKEQQLL